jgi:DNA-binding NtrC family response regulator
VFKRKVTLHTHFLTAYPLNRCVIRVSLFAQVNLIPLQKAPMSVPSESVRVLVVDDERIIADTLVLILKTRKYDALAAYSGEDAVALAAAFRPHAVISDVMMGNTSGMDLTIYLQREQPDCKVLLFSGKAEGLDLMKYANPDDYDHLILSKPVHPERILEFVAACALRG